MIVNKHVSVQHCSVVTISRSGLYMLKRFEEVTTCDLVISSLARKSKYMCFKIIIQKVISNRKSNKLSAQLF